MKLVTNRKARFNYHIIETFEAGIKLKGTEIKSLRAGGGNLEGSFARITEGKLLLVNCSIAPFEHGNIYNHEEKRDRILLMHKKEIEKLSQKIKEKGMTLVPLSIYLKKGLAKLELALATGKQAPDKRKAIREKEEKRKIERVMKKHR